MSEDQADYKTEAQEAMEMLGAGYQRSGYIYLMKPFGVDRKVYKIGYSIDPVKRLAVKQKRVDYELELFKMIWVKDCSGIEQYLHDDYSRYRLAGEWFVLPYQVVDNFEKIVCEINDQWGER